MFHEAAPAFLRRLPQRERQIADAVATMGEACAADVIAALPDRITNSAVRSMLSRLESKGVLRKRVEGNRYIYRPAFPVPELRQAMLRRIADEHFGGSLSALAAELTRMIDPPRSRH
jgi:predicted transcriptional regulator